MLNLMIALGTLLGAIFGLAGTLVVGTGLTVWGALNFLNQVVRGRIRSWIFYGACWAAFYIGGHILIAYCNPSTLLHPSGWSIIWTMVFVIFSAYMIWRSGGLVLDLTILASITPDDEDDLADYLNSQPGGLAPGLMIILSLWRRMGRGLFSFLRFVFMVSLLVGMYFVLIPPSMNWKMFGVITLAFTGYLISKQTEFNWKKWNTFCKRATIAAVVITLTTPWLDSFSLPTYKHVIGPATSMYGQVSHDTVALTAGGRALSVKAGTKLLLINPTPHMDKASGLEVVTARLAINPTDWRYGFRTDEVHIIAEDFDRLPSLTDNSSSENHTTAPLPISRKLGWSAWISDPDNMLMTLFFCFLALAITAKFGQNKTSTAAPAAKSAH